MKEGHSSSFMGESGFIFCKKYVICSPDNVCLSTLFSHSTENILIS